MKVRMSLFANDCEDMSLEELINHILRKEDGWFLDQLESEELYEEFASYAYDYLADSEDVKEFNSIPKESVISALIDVRDFINEENYDEYVQTSAQFMEDVWREDFRDDNACPLFGDVKNKAFKDAIKLLYGKYCNEKVE